MDDLCCSFDPGPESEPVTITLGSLTPRVAGVLLSSGGFPSPNSKGMSFVVDPGCKVLNFLTSVGLPSVRRTITQSLVAQRARKATSLPALVSQHWVVPSRKDACGFCLGPWKLFATCNSPQQVHLDKLAGLQLLTPR